jgi:hypothetical protein
MMSNRAVLGCQCTCTAAPEVSRPLECIRYRGISCKFWPWHRTRSLLRYPRIRCHAPRLAGSLAQACSLAQAFMDTGCDVVRSGHQGAAVASTGTAVNRTMCLGRSGADSNLNGRDRRFFAAAMNRTASKTEPGPEAGEEWAERAARPCGISGDASTALRSLGSQSTAGLQREVPSAVRTGNIYGEQQCSCKCARQFQRTTG